MPAKLNHYGWQPADRQQRYSSLEINPHLDGNDVEIASGFGIWMEENRQFVFWCVRNRTRRARWERPR
jgi:hypothetical protein